MALGLALGLLAAALAACGEDSGAAAEGPSVVATTAVAADIVGRVAGDDVEVAQLVPDGASPHSYSPSASEQQRLTEAELLVYFSPALEEALPIEEAGRSLSLAEHAGDRSGVGPGDPHVWMDPTRVAAALPALADALSEIAPEHARSFERRASEYAAELAELDREIAATVDSIPPENRKLVTSHESLGYFADRYGLAFVGAPFGVSPEAEASAERVAELIGLVESEQVPAVFAQEGDDPEVLARIADQAGVEVVDDLRIESLGDSSSYAEMLRYTAARIADGLRGGDG